MSEMKTFAPSRAKRLAVAKPMPVPAAAVIGEAVVAFVLAQALVEKFGGDSVASLDAAVDRYRAVLAR